MRAVCRARRCRARVGDEQPRRAVAGRREHQQELVEFGQLHQRAWETQKKGSRLCRCSPSRSTVPPHPEADLSRRARPRRPDGWQTVTRSTAVRAHGEHAEVRGPREGDQDVRAGEPRDGRDAHRGVPAASSTNCAKSEGTQGGGGAAQDQLRQGSREGFRERIRTPKNLSKLSKLSKLSPVIRVVRKTDDPIEVNEPTELAAAADVVGGRASGRTGTAARGRAAAAGPASRPQTLCARTFWGLEPKRGRGNRRGSAAAGTCSTGCSTPRACSTSRCA